MAPICHLDDLPDDMLEQTLVEKLSATELCMLAQVSRRYKDIAGNDRRWKALFQERWGQGGPLTTSALKRAGSWRKYYASKYTCDRLADPWRKPCEPELAASIDLFTQGWQHGSELAVVFLVDGSGSVQDDDFKTMTDFMANCSDAVRNTVPDFKVAVVQFSNDVRVEIPPTTLDGPALEAMIASMVRMAGGTNIALAIQRAGQLLKKNMAEDAHRVVVLLTDGRVDSYQAKEAMHMAARLADEQRNVQLFAYGVGRGVDKSELVKIISASGSEDAELRYVDLCVHDDPPW